jgi:hypothetical protein
MVKDQETAYQLKRRLALEKMRKNSAKRYLKNKEKLKKKRREHYQNNRERIRLQRRWANLTPIQQQIKRSDARIYNRERQQRTKKKKARDSPAPNYPVLLPSDSPDDIKDKTFDITTLHQSQKTSKRLHFKNRTTKSTNQHTTRTVTLVATAVLPADSQAQMYVQQLAWCDENKAALDAFHHEILMVRETTFFWPANGEKKHSMFVKPTAKRRVNKNRGTLYLGYCSAPGHPNTSRVDDMNCPYLYKGHKMLKYYCPSLLQNTNKLIKMIWDLGSLIFVDESKKLLACVDVGLAFPGTGFTNGGIQINMATGNHIDDDNVVGGWQGVLVLGLGSFVGGSVHFRTYKKNKNVFVVVTKHGTIFFGKNGAVWHEVQKVTSGSRLIVACWTNKLTFKFSKDVLKKTRMTWERAWAVRDARGEETSRLHDSLGGNKFSTQRIRAKKEMQKKWRQHDVARR